MVTTARPLRDAAAVAALTVLGVIALVGLLVVTGALLQVPAAVEERRQNFGSGESLRGVAVVMAIGDALIAGAAVGLVQLARVFRGRRRTIVRASAAVILAFAALALLAGMVLEAVL